MATSSIPTSIIRHIYISKTLLEKRANNLIYREFNLTESSFFPMRFIYEGVCTISGMKKFSTESSASLTQKMSRLEKLGLVVRYLVENDKRKWKFKLSTKGNSVFNKIITKEKKALDNLFEDFSKKDKLCLDKLLQDLQQKLQNST